MPEEEEYRLSYTGQQVDEAIGKALAGGGITVGAGYKFSAIYYSMYGAIEYKYLGVSKTKYLEYGGSAENPDYNKYGWHSIGNSGGFDENDNPATQENVSFVIMVGFGSSPGDFVSITQNALYLYDGTAINDYNGLVSAKGKLCFLVKDCAIEFED